MHLAGDELEGIREGKLFHGNCLALAVNALIKILHSEYGFLTRMKGAQGEGRGSVQQRNKVTDSNDSVLGTLIFVSE